jgi:hypothetical protein
LQTHGFAWSGNLYAPHVTSAAEITMSLHTPENRATRTTTEPPRRSALVGWLRSRGDRAADPCDDLQREQRLALQRAGRIRPR